MSPVASFRPPVSLVVPRLPPGVWQKTPWPSSCATTSTELTCRALSLVRPYLVWSRLASPLPAQL
jgi:hypothetical protein